MRRNAMKDRTLAVVITILVVLLCACPGVAFICIGLVALLEIIVNAAYSSYVIDVFGYRAAYWAIGGLGLGVIAIVLTVVVAVLVLRQRKDSVPAIPPPPPPPPQEPVPPTI
jgi:hypothetical protein